MTVTAGRVAILGGGGFIGRTIAGVLAEYGWRVEVVNRGLRTPPTALPSNIHHVCADRSAPEHYECVLRGLEVDAVVDSTAYRPDEAALAAKAFRGRISLGLHLGSLSSYQPPHPLPIPEEWPLKQADAESYGAGKAGCERALEGQGEWCRLRLPAIMGPGDPASREGAWRRALLTGWPLAVPGGCDSLFQVVLVSDLARLCVRLLDNGHAARGLALNVAGPPVTLRRYLGVMASILGVAPPVLSVAERAGDMSDGRWPHVHGRDLVLDASRLNGLLPDFVFTPLPQAMEQCLGDQTEDGAWVVPVGDA